MLRKHKNRVYVTHQLHTPIIFENGNPKRLHFVITLLLIHHFFRQIEMYKLDSVLV